MSRAITALSAAALLSSAQFAAADTATLEMIPFAVYAMDMSPDGRYVVGGADWNLDGFADGSFLWDGDTGELTDLGNGVDPSTGIPAVALSDDGTVVLGNMRDPNDPNNLVSKVAAIWHADTGIWQSLGYLPNAGRCPSRSSAYELSADGSVAVGLSWDGCDGRAFRWTEATGMVEMQPFANGGNRASVVSADGTLLAGFSRGPSSRTPSVWDDTGAGELLDPPNGIALGEIYGMNDAGTILLGNWHNDPNLLVAQATKWTKGPGGWERELIGAGSRLPGWVGVGMDIADDGTIVGFDFLLGNRQAWFRPYETGPIRNMKAYINNHGGFVPADMGLEVSRKISTDGRYIIGLGSFGTSAWRVTYIRCPGDLTSDNVVDLADLALFLSNFGTPSGALQEDGDMDDDGDVDLADLAIMLSLFGTTCS